MVDDTELNWYQPISVDDTVGVALLHVTFILLIVL